MDGGFFYADPQKNLFFLMFILLAFMLFRVQRIRTKRAAVHLVNLSAA